MKFCRVYDNKRYGQIVIMKKQSEEGAPEIRLFFQPEGFGVCNFAIGFKSDDAPESAYNQAFNEITLKVAIEIIDGYMDHMTSKAGEKH